MPANSWSENDSYNELDEALSSLLSDISEPEEEAEEGAEEGQDIQVSLAYKKCGCVNISSVSILIDCEQLQTGMSMHSLICILLSLIT